MGRAGVIHTRFSPGFMVRGFVSLFNCKRENHGEQDLSGVYTGYIRRFNLQHWWGIAERSGVNAACRLRVVMREISLWGNSPHEPALNSELWAEG